jgi:phage-related protein
MPSSGPKRLRAVFYQARDGSEPVNDFIERLPNDKHKAAVDNQIDRINALCTSSQPDLPFPHSSQVVGQLRELRCHFGRNHYRILYRRSQNFVILLHAFVRQQRRSRQGRSARPRRTGTTSRLGWTPSRESRPARSDTTLPQRIARSSRSSGSRAKGFA